MSKIDLHLHSYFSDGSLSPTQLLIQAKKSGHQVVSLTDHNGISGLLEAQAAAKKLRLKLITGLEFYCIYKKRRIHILGYDFKLDHPALQRIISSAQAKHQERISKVLLKASKVGFVINQNQINKAKSSYLGWDVIIGSLQANPKNLMKINREVGKDADLLVIFDHYFSPGRPGHVPAVDWPAAQFIKAVKLAGGVAVLAHPGQQLSFADDKVIIELKKKGIAGLEVFTPYHNWHQLMHYQRLAYDNKLIMTGGTDYHGPILDKKLTINSQWEYFSIPDKIYKQGLGKLIK
ncbi:PHP domain-containing protein [Patescibacteria group bacterium]|nr:PHP domain-containing protein [Patescibacteria group bacterium]